jgi:hypothetical protein
MGPVPTLEWSAPTVCPDANQVRAAIHGMLDASSWSRAPAGMIARGAVSQGDDGRFVLRVQIDAGGASETKTIDADTCATLADAYAVIVAFAIDPGARPRENLSASAGPSRETPTHPTPAEELPPPIPTRGVVGPLFVAGAGFLPFPAVGVGARIGIESTLWWQLAGVYWPERTASVAMGPGTTIEAHVTLVSIEPGVCLPMLRGAVATCAATELGVMPATGTGMARPGSGQSPWIAPSAAVAFRVPVARVVDLRLRLGVGFPILRPTFVAQNIGPQGLVVQVYQPAPVFGTVSVEGAVSLFSTESGEARHVGR